LKFTPDLEFEEDVGPAQAERLTQLLKKIEAEGSEG
jgi:ribosome-binding factor A